MESSQNVQQEGSCSAVDLSPDTGEVQFTNQTPEGGRCYILAVKARPLSPHLFRKDRFLHFYSDAVCISGSDNFILANALKTNKRVLKYINTFTEGLSLL